MNLQKEQEIAEQKTSMMEFDDIRTAIFEEMADSNMEEDAQSSEADKTFAQEDEEPSEAVEPESVVVEEGKHSETDFNKLSQEDIFSIYEKRLEELRIDNRITVGEWNVGLLQNGKLSLSATNPTDKALEEIFQLYDFGEMEPLFTWAEDVYEVAEELEEIFDANWIIDVGGNCRSVGPETLPQTDIMNYSGSCGISIPVLSGTSREDLSLIINEKVFFHGDDGVTMRDMESSRIVEEIDVEATITEIRAIYHRINESLDDRLFVQKLEEHETKYLNASGIMEKKVVYDRNTDITTEYYAWGDGLLCFVFTTDGFGNENRYYFKDNLLIRWIDENRQTIDIQEGRNNPQYLEWEAHWIEEFY